MFNSIFTQSIYIHDFIFVLETNSFIQISKDLNRLETFLFLIPTSFLLTLHHALQFSFSYLLLTPCLTVLIFLSITYTMPYSSHFLIYYLHHALQFSFSYLLLTPCLTVLIFLSITYTMPYSSHFLIYYYLSFQLYSLFR